MAAVRVLVLRGPGINCDEETVLGWQMAGAEPQLLHVNRLVERPGVLEEFQILTVPGGFSYGDDIAAGAVFASVLRDRLAAPLRRFVDAGGGVLGICNGFQILVKAGLLPGPGVDVRVTVTFNDSARFEARWVRLQVATDRCVYLRAGSTLELPVEHGEGRVITDGDVSTGALERGGYVAVRYVGDDGRPAGYPENPNGSVAGIAGLCDATGRVFGLMPHPDRFLFPTNHPQWTRRGADAPADGLTVFRSAVEYWTQNGKQSGSQGVRESGSQGVSE
ncbi:MAG: phosphoribosylformylglycinamidine synthase I [Phycisphaerales bacterium]|nr:MAG: phosphoribosylformylglycinamidine synthase I [Phycisphaerales bacterium]